jgi:hypothetical protein
VAKEKKATEYRVANYDGHFKAVPEAGLSGKVEVTPEGMWQLHLGFRKNVQGRFASLPFEVEPLSEQSCRVTVRNVDNPSYGVRFDLPDTTAAELQADLAERGFLIEAMMAGAVERQRRKAGGAWWVDIRPYRILIGCHYSGARKKDELGDLRATGSGLEYKAMLGSKVTIPWQAIQDIEVSTQSARRVTAGRAVALGVFALAAKKNETYTYIHISDANTVWSFADKAAQGKVLASMKPILDAFNKRVRAPLPPTAPPSPPVSAPPSAPIAAPTLSVADELAKLAKLRADGVLTDDEFAAQKAKLLG